MLLLRATTNSQIICQQENKVVLAGADKKRRQKGRDGISTANDEPRIVSILCWLRLILRIRGILPIPTFCCGPH